MHIIGICSRALDIQYKVYIDIYTLSRAMSWTKPRMDTNTLYKGSYVRMFGAATNVAIPNSEYL